jgi:predicted PurR-regulated permease PerM
MKKEQRKQPVWRLEPLLGMVALLLLLFGCAWVLRPFLSALMWAIILSYALYPLQRLFTRWFRGSRTLAAVFVTITVTLILAGPLVLIGVRLAKDGKDLAMATRHWLTSVTTEPPVWLARTPVVGDELATYWTGFAEDKNRWLEQLDKEVKNPPRAVIVPDQPQEEGEEVADVPRAEGLATQEGPADEAVDAEGKSHIISMLGRFLAWAYDWLLAAGLAVGQGLAQVLISAFLAFFLLRDSATLSGRLSVAVERLAGERGRRLIQVAGATVRGVIYGILGTAVAQALVAWAGFWFAGVPGAVLLAVLTFFFAVVPFGPPLIWLPAAFWLFANDKPGMGVFLLLWGVLAISSVDNILRPFLISQGSKMPFALIFCGVIGGALAFGLVGVFLGPTLLAVAYRLIDEWSAVNPNPPMGEPALISVLQEKADSPTPPAHGR